MFHSARIKLTAWYLLIIIFICIIFSAVIYKVLVYEVERFERAQRFRIERRLHIPAITSPELLEETKQRILFMLLAANLGIVIISGGLGYFLAGKTLEPIQEMVDEQNRFISDASHELRTPLTSLKSAFEVYARNPRQTLSDAKILAAESIQEVNKLQSLSESLLQLAQYQNPNKHMAFKKIYINHVVQEAIRNIKSIAQQKNITVISGNTKIEIEGNFYSLAELTVILLDNAIKYSEPEKSIHVEIQKKDNFIFISIIDQGFGIDKHDIPRIFDRFYRADQARTKSSSGGYGLGLSIAKRIVEMHKGTINVQSAAGKGSTFTVRLPIKQSFS